MVKRVAAAVVVAAGAAKGQPSFHALGVLDPNIGGPSIGEAVSSDGTVVAGYSNSPEGFQAFRWTAATGLVGLGTFSNPGGFPSSQGYCISGDGAVVGGASVRPNSLNENGSPFRWTSGGGMVFPGSLGGTEGGSVNGLSPDGSIMVGTASSQDFSYRAFMWTAATGNVALPAVQNQASAGAQALTPDASVIVGFAGINSMANPHAVVWRLSGGSYTASRLPELNVNTISSALAVTPDGAVIVGQSAGRAVRWTETGIQNLGEIPGGIAGSTYIATAVSADGNTVVGLANYNATQGTGTAFIWDPARGMRDLNFVLASDFGLDLGGFQCFYARGISADGKVIVGYGFGAQFQEPFVADLHTAAVCYANCDGSTTAPVLNVLDFGCFLNRFAAGDTYANCDASTTPPVLNVLDFGCFLNRFAAGCT